LLTGRSSFFGLKYSHPDLGHKKGISDFLVIGYPYSENTCNFMYVTSLFELSDKVKGAIDGSVLMIYIVSKTENFMGGIPI